MPKQVQLHQILHKEMKILQAEVALEKGINRTFGGKMVDGRRALHAAAARPMKVGADEGMPTMTPRTHCP